MSKHKRTSHYAAAGLSLALFAGMTSVGFVGGSKLTSSAVAVPMQVSDTPMQGMNPNQMYNVTGFDPQTGDMMRDTNVRQANLPFMQRLASGPEVQGTTRGGQQGQGANTFRTQFEAQARNFGRTPSVSGQMRNGLNQPAMGTGEGAPSSFGSQASFGRPPMPQHDSMMSRGFEQGMTSSHPEDSMRGQMSSGMSFPSSNGRSDDYMRGQMSSGMGTQGDQHREEPRGQREQHQGDTTDISAMLAKLQTAYDKLQTKIDVTEGKLDKAEAALEAATTEAAKKSAQRQVERLTKNIERLEDMQDAISSRMDELEMSAIEAQ